MLLFQTATHNLLRIIAGLLFAQHGAQKLFGALTDRPPVELLSLMGLAGVLELFGGALIALGLLTRPIAFVLSGEMAVAYFMAHLPRDFWPIRNGGELAALYAFIFLYFAAWGAGRWSLDHLLRGVRAAPAAATANRAI